VLLLLFLISPESGNWRSWTGTVQRITEKENLFIYLPPYLENTSFCDEMLHFTSLVVLLLLAFLGFCKILVGEGKKKAIWDASSRVDASYD